MKREDFKYTIPFEAVAKVSLGDIVKINGSNSLLAKASLDDLKGLLPSTEEVEENPDLLYTSFNAAVINLINANDHGMSTDTALSVAKYFKDRHMNVEHNRYNVIGHIMNYGFSTFGDNKLVTPESLKGTTKPFNLCLAAIVYRIVDEWMAEMIEDSTNPEHYLYKEISASWEVGYNEYDIVLGSKKLEDAEILTDDAKIREFNDFLKINGGTGFADDGTPVYALIKGDARPLGCAFTFSPAAAVEGLVTAKKEKEGEKIHGTVRLKSAEPLKAELTEDDKKELVKTVEAGVKTAFSEISKEKNQQNQKTTVNKDMKIKAIEDITTEFLQEAKASDVTSFIRDELQKKSTEFDAELETAKQEKQNLADSLATIEETKENLETKVGDLEGEITSLKETIAAKEKDEAFNIRMAELEESYELSDEQRNAVASQIGELSDEDYESWKKSFALFASVKKEEETTETSKEDKASDALETATPDNTEIPNGQGGESDPMQKMVESFTKGVKIS